MNVPDDVVGNVFEHLDLEEATQLRCLSRRFLRLVSSHEWETQPVACFNLAKWSICFPRATTLCYHSDEIDVVGRFLLPHLKHVSLHNCVVMNSSLENLHTLQLNQCLLVTAASFGHLKNLTFLDLTRCTEFDGCALFGLTKLTTLIVSACTQLLDCHFATLSNLTRLDVDSLHLTGDVCMNKKLKDFSARDAVVFRRFFQHLTGLEKLDLANTVVPVASFHVCAATLVTINLDYVSWQGYGIEEMPHLKRASLRGTRFETLRPFRNAWWVDLTDAWLDGVRDFRGHLQFLNISLGSYSDPYFLCNLTSVNHLVSYKCFLPNRVFEECPTIENWSVGCEILKHLKEETLLKKLKVQFMETCHGDMCYCD